MNGNLKVYFLFSSFILAALVPKGSNAEHPPESKFSSTWDNSLGPLLPQVSVIVSSDFAATTVKLGEFPGIDGARIELVLNNQSGRSLVLANVDSSCGCLAGHIEGEQLGLNGSQKVRMILSPQYLKTKIRRQVNLYFKDENKPLCIHIEGDVQPAVQVVDFQCQMGRTGNDPAPEEILVSFSLELLSPTVGPEDVLANFRRLDVPIDTSVRSNGSIQCNAIVPIESFGISVSRDVMIEFTDKTMQRRLGLFETNLSEDGHITIAPALPAFRESGEGLSERLLVRKKNCDDVAAFMENCRWKLLENDKPLPLSVKSKAIGRDSAMVHLTINSSDRVKIDWNATRLLLADENGNILRSIAIWDGD